MVSAYVNDTNQEQWRDGDQTNVQNVSGRSRLI